MSERKTRTTPEPTREPAREPADSWLTTAQQRQQRLGPLGLIIFMSLTFLVTPLSIDMYTPAVPSMVTDFKSSSAMMNLTMLCFYLTYSLSMLLIGPLSDRHGRKPILIIGTAVFSIGSLATALSPSIWWLIASRVIQALGAACIGTVVTALVKDCFAQAHRSMVLTIVQTIYLVGPMAAPLLGSAILARFDWRFIFLFLAVFGLASLVATILLLRESLQKDQRLSGSSIASLKRLVVVARNPGFSLYLIVTASFSIASIAYVGVGSYIFIDFFKLSEVDYSLFFAVTAAFAITGPLVYALLAKRISARHFTFFLLAITLCGGVCLLLYGHRSPYLFCLAILPLMFSKAAVRPYSIAILLEQQESDTGSASALINFTIGIFGCIGMLLGMIPQDDFITGLALATIVTMVLAGILYIGLLQSSATIRGLD